jgi:hypothetical protein
MSITDTLRLITSEIAANMHSSGGSSRLSASVLPVFRDAVLVGTAA